MAFAKTHVLNIWNSVLGIETEREIFSPASVTGERLLVGLKEHASLPAGDAKKLHQQHLT